MSNVIDEQRCSKEKARHRPKHGGPHADRHGDSAYAEGLRCVQNGLFTWAATDCDTILPVVQSCIDTVSCRIAAIKRSRVAIITGDPF